MPCGSINTTIKTKYKYFNHHISIMDWPTAIMIIGVVGIYVWGFVRLVTDRPW